MVYSLLVKRSWRWLRRWVWMLADSAPPYRITEGTLDDKGVDDKGIPFIVVASEKVSVDGGTMNALSLGEALRVRHTRGNRAVNIDRILPPNGEEP